MTIRSIHSDDVRAKGRGVMEINTESSISTKRRRRWPWIAGGAVAVVITAAGVIGANSDKPASNGSTPAEPPSLPTTSSAAPNSTPASATSSSSTASPSSQADPPADPVEKLRAAFRAEHGDQAWFGKVPTVDLDGRAVIARSTMTKGDQEALAACEALRGSAAMVSVDFQSVAIRDEQDKTLAHWSRLTGDAACTN